MNENSSKKTLAPEYFEAVYNANDDPWNFTASEYEARKYVATMAALPRKNYASAFEIGCSIGILTEKLAASCERLLSVDINDKALVQARARCAELPQVRFEKLFVPAEFPDENFDLIVVSEVGYYLSVEDWTRTQEKITAHLNSGGNVVLVHWTHFVHDYPQTGDGVHEHFAANAAGKLKLLTTNRTDDYRLDVWEKANNSI